MMNRIFTVQSMNLTSDNGWWWDEKDETSFKRAVAWAEKAIATDASLNLSDRFAYRIIERATNTELWRSEA